MNQERDQALHSSQGACWIIGTGNMHTYDYDSTPTLSIPCIQSTVQPVAACFKFCFIQVICQYVSHTRMMCHMHTCVEMSLGPAGPHLCTV